MNIRGGWARPLYQLLKLYLHVYDTCTTGIHLMAILCVAAERGGLIKKKKKVHR